MPRIQAVRSDSDVDVDEKTKQKRAVKENEKQHPSRVSRLKTVVSKSVVNLSNAINHSNTKATQMNGFSFDHTHILSYVIIECEF